MGNGDLDSPPIPTSLPEYAYQHLREAILGGRLAAGEPLRQEKLSAELRVSRLPVREALRRLDTEGLVILRPRRGYYVALLDTKEIEELFDIRGMLEARAGHLAAVNRDAVDLSELATLLGQLEAVAVARPLDMGDFYKLNRLFHERLFQSSKRQHLCRLLNSVLDSLTPYIRRSSNVTSVSEAQQDHRELFEAIRRGDARGASRLCKEHCEASCKRILRYVV